MASLRELYLKLPSEELKRKIQVYNGALKCGDVTEKTYEAMHGYVNEIIDILKERNEL
jgi:hypothetical protein